LKLAISNLSFGDTPLYEVLPKLRDLGIDGIEIAPTAIWPNIDSIEMNDVKRAQNKINEYGLKVSGIQSLLYGHPEFQLFDKSTWPAMKSYLEKMIEIAGSLGANVAVFGSPRNRLKGEIKTEIANLIAAEFFSLLIPALEQNNVVLTLEPNAAEYGADYLMTYEDVNTLSNLIDSRVIGPQIDTGCLWMAGKDPLLAIDINIPEHIHISAPNMALVLGNESYDHFIQKIVEVDYKGWLVLEMLGDKIGNDFEWVESVKWIIQLRENLLGGL
jgi:D-psicose/D-tagatose/L-ribulose 3-epimerase